MVSGAKMLAFICIGLFVVIGLSDGAPRSGHTIVQDWYSTNFTVIRSGKPTNAYVGEFGYLKHTASRKYIVPKGGLCPGNDNPLIIGDMSKSDANLFRFVQVEGHLGYIEHFCGRLAHPKGGSANPGQSTRVELHGDRHGGAEYYFDEEAKHIVHIGKKIFHPYGGSTNPSHGTTIRLHSDIHHGSRFEFEPKSAYPDPALTGRWVVLFAAINPISEHTYTIEYKVGKSVSKQATEMETWKVSAETSLSWFQSSSEYSKMACISESETWDNEMKRTYTVKVYPGQTSVTWQWMFGSERLDEAFQFRSTIVADTDDINKPPVIDPQMFPNTC